MSLITLTRGDLADMLQLARTMVFRLLGTVVAIMAVMAAADYLFQ